MFKIFLILLNLLIFSSVSFSEDTACSRMESILSSGEAASTYPFQIDDYYAQVNNFGLMMIFEESTN